MSIERNKTVARRAFDFWNGADLREINQFFADDVIIHDPSTPSALGRGGEATRIKLYRTAFPDLTFSVEDVFGEGDKVVVRWTTRGTHLGDLMGIPPTGRTQQISGTSVMHFKDGRIAEYWVNWDAMGLMQQLGVIPVAG